LPTACRSYLTLSFLPDTAGSTAFIAHKLNAANAFTATLEGAFGFGGALARATGSGLALHRCASTTLPFRLILLGPYMFCNLVELPLRQALEILCIIVPSGSLMCLRCTRKKRCGPLMLTRAM
jgi:hypothetical protein